MAPAAIKRMVGSDWFVTGFPTLGAVGGIGFGVCLSVAISAALRATGVEAVPSLTGAFLMGIGGVSGWGLGDALAQREHRKRFLAAIRNRGSPDEITVRFDLSDAGLSIVTPQTTQLFTYEAILEVIETAKAWLIQVDTTTIYLPKRAFSDREWELRFIRQMLGRMKPEARDRSDKPALA